MNIVDIIIIIFILLGGIIGFKRGAIRELVSLCGFAIIVIISFLFKSPLAKILCKFFPFFSFKGLFAGVTVLNILVYEIISFLIILSILTGILQIVIFASNILEKIIKLTLIFTLPSKLIGFVLGLIENYIVTFVVLYILSLPVFQVNVLINSTFKDKILNNTPILNVFTQKFVDLGNDFVELKDKYKFEEDKEKLNLESLDLLLKYKLVDVDLVDDLIESNKLKIDNVESILKNYRD